MFLLQSNQLYNGPSLRHEIVRRHRYKLNRFAFGVTRVVYETLRKTHHIKCIYSDLNVH